MSAFIAILISRLILAPVLVFEARFFLLRARRRDSGGRARPTG